MIQRIQTLWLVLAAVAASLSIKSPFYTGHLVPDNSFVQLNATTNNYILILTILSIAASVIAIFFYKNRMKQTIITVVNLIISIGIIFLYILEIKKFVEGSFSLTSLFVFVIPVFLILALVGIQKDKKLIKSLDRLR